MGWGGGRTCADVMQLIRNQCCVYLSTQLEYDPTGGNTRNGGKEKHIDTRAVLACFREKLYVDG